MEAEFLAFVAPLPDDEILRPADPPRGHGRPGNALGVTWEIACTLGASVAMGDSPEDEQLVAHRWAWLASDPEWLRLFRTEMTHILVSCLEVALPEEKYNPLCAEVLEAIPDALCEDGGSLTRLKARARLHRSSGPDGCAAKCAPIEPPAPHPLLPRPHLGMPPLALFTLAPLPAFWTATRTASTTRVRGSSTACSVSLSTN